MCGIAGFLLRCTDATARLDRMVEGMAARGPDGRGTFTSPTGEISLGHTRLSIIDLSEAGRQPMSSESGRLQITFNGEIYNFREIRSELEREGRSFRTQCDTEVVLAGWERWGPEVLGRLRGMFAFAIWDESSKQLVLCRDRLGIKPLLWAPVGSGVVFASSLRALLASRLVEPRIEARGLFDLLATGAVCQPGTLVRGVHSLEPGTFMTCRQDGTKSSGRYWDLAKAAAKLAPDLAGITHGGAVELVRGLLEESCKYHLVADVPVASFLSGGIDSTAITAIMSRQSSARVRSFTVGFAKTDDLRDEREDARRVAAHIGTDHTEVVITGREAAESFDDLIRAVDQPSYDGANTFFVSRAAGRSVKVAMSGLGGDELFAGYEHFEQLQRAAEPGLPALDRAVRRLNRIRPNRLTARRARIAELRLVGKPKRYASLRRDLEDSDLTGAFVEPVQQQSVPGFVERVVEPLLCAGLDSVTQTSIVECHGYLLNTLLRDADAMSMGNGLEVRPALLDHHLVEHAVALPARVKLVGRRGKAVLKDAVADLLPESLLDRPKTGFTLPMGAWVRGELRGRVLDTLGSSAARTLFSACFLASCSRRIDDPAAGRVLWTLLVLLSWMTEHGIRGVE